MDFAVHVRADVVAGGDDLAVGALPHVRAGDAFEVLNAQGHIARPRRSVNAQRLRQIIHPHFVHELQELVGIHNLISCVMFWQTPRKLF